ncbi:YHYH protein [Pseudoalteromonas rubra]|uniref:YHYH protein n=1 Tax=Pseudoalteromonas rubra TaxID=43658 RepID=UPI001F0C58D5|nr:YHYH protein [Pseudoalteromonas rubra]
MNTVHKRTMLATWVSMLLLSACGSGGGSDTQAQPNSLSAETSSTNTGSATQSDSTADTSSDNNAPSDDSNTEETESGANTDTGTALTSGSTDGVLCDYFYNEFNDSVSVQMTSNADWSCTGSSRQLTANGIPDHETGTFPNPGNPNTISETAVSVSYTLTPEQTDTASTLGGPRGATGYVLNGVKIDANTAGSCDDSGNSCSLVGNTGNWHIEALGQTSFDFGTDDNNAHVQPNGSYHYHGMPEGFIALRGGDSTSMTLIGWAADGFPIYARYGYSDAQDATSSLKAMTGSYQLVENVSSNRPSTSVYALGTFAQDWEYVAGSGDLDECNGRYGVTPEFPQGIYHYYATDTYPYFQRCVKGQL